MKKNDILELRITALTGEGAGIARVDGLVVFVPFTAVGDVIEAKILKVTSNCAYAKIEKILTPSELRTENKCPSFGRCGGCTLRHIDYKAEAAAKEAQIKDAFVRIGKLTPEFLPILENDSPDRYRNKAQYPIAKDKDGKVVYGFFASNSHNVIPCGDCLLQPEIFAEIMDVVCKYIADEKIAVYNETEHKGVIRHVCIREGFHSGEINVTLVARRKVPEFNRLGRMIMEKFSRVKGVVLNINPDQTNVIFGSKEITLAGSAEITDVMCGRKISISPRSFYQINTNMAEKLYAAAKEFAEPEGKILLDLYCGAGTIGLSMADEAKKLVGVEIVASAVENAVINAQLNGFNEAEFICGDAGEATESLVGRLQPDVVILDPARRGCDKKTLDNVLKFAPERVVMISCNPSTAARDCAYLSENGYAVKKVRGVDMFSRTGHVETVCLLSKLHGAKHHVNVTLDMDELDITSAESKATYEEIKDYVLEKHGLQVTNLYIAQVKRKYGIIERENYNKSQKEDAKQPQCPEDKEKAIMDALEHFGMV